MIAQVIIYLADQIIRLIVELFFRCGVQEFVPVRNVTSHRRCGRKKHSFLTGHAAPSKHQKRWQHTEQKEELGANFRAVASCEKTQQGGHERCEHDQKRTHLES